MNPYIFHISLYDLVFLGTIFIGLTFSFQMWFTKKTDILANRFLGLALVIIVLWMVRLLAIDIRLGTYFSHWDWLPLQFSLALGPLIFFYVLKITRTGYKFGLKDLLHFSPLLLELGVQIVAIKQSMETGGATYNTPAFHQLNPILQLLAFVSVSIYLFWSHRLIERFYRRQKFIGGDRHRLKMRWLRNLLTGFGLLWLLWIPLTTADYFYYHHHLAIQAYYPLYLLLAVVFIRIAALAFLRPGAEFQANTPAVSTPPLPAEMKQKGTWLKQAMKTSRYYQDPELSLSSLAEKLNLGPHELSRIINTIFKKSFNDFINEYRVAEVIRKMQYPAYDHITLMGIAYDSGFNSKSAFHRIFKERTGKSPAEYNTQLKKELPSYNLGQQSQFATIISYHETTPKWSHDKLTRNYMFKIYFKTAFRQLLKNKLFSLVNIGGLSIGLASIMALSLLIYQYVTTDNNEKDINQMYYLKTEVPGGIQYTQTPYPLLGEIVKDCPEVDAATHIQQWYFPWLKFSNKEFQETTTFVDTSYFKVFQFPFKYGNVNRALYSEFSIVLSEEIAEKFFGKNVNPIGKVITADDTLQLTVTGVLMHIPTNSTVRPSILIPTALLESNRDFKSGANWYNAFADNYLRLRKNSNLKILNKKIAEIIRLNYAPEQKANKVFAIPFTKISEENSSIVGVIIKGAIGAGFFILVIILLNLVNLNTASVFSRSKEVAVKQMIGGSKKDIIIQFCIENGLIVFISVLLAWIFFSLILLQNINDLVKDKFGEIETSLSKDYPLIIVFTGIGLLFTVLAGSLPALKLAALKVTDAVKGKLASGNYKGGGSRNIFITIQFVFAITLICVTIILHKQISFMKSFSLGFDKDNIAVAKLDLAFRDQKSADSRFRSIMNELKNDPHVRSFSLNTVIPTAYWDNFNGYYDPNTHTEVRLQQATADAGYLPTFKIPLIQGKNFDDNFAASEKKSVLINRAAMSAFGWKNAVGKQIIAKGSADVYTVMGVMEDFHYRDLQGGIEPVVQSYTGKPSLETNYLSIRTDNGYITPIMQRLQQSFKSIPSRRTFSYDLMSNKVTQQYSLLDGILRVTNYIAMLTILIACMGMFGLIALFAKLRIKEIGIRKVLGSSEFGIVKLLSKDFIILIGIAFVIAAPIAWYLMDKWLQDFAFRINISWWLFLLIGSIVMLIALATVSFEAIKAAIANPVKSLRSE